MKVVEIFNSIDGEGKRAGELTTFIRLYGCNLNCSYCDSRYAWQDGEYTEMAIDEIIEEVKKYRTKNITVTGGEPLIHKDITYLLRALGELNYDVNVETNGSVDISKYTVMESGLKIVDSRKYGKLWFTIDYKCLSSGQTNKMYSDNFNTPCKNCVYKFVVGNTEDLDKALPIITNLINKESVYIYLSPVFGSIEPKDIVTYMQEKNLYSFYSPVRVQLQLHKFIWSPDEKGV